MLLEGCIRVAVLTGVAANTVAGMRRVWLQKELLFRTSSAGARESAVAQSYLGLWYQKIASATSATVMIQRMMSLVRLFSFSSAISGVQHT